MDAYKTVSKRYQLENIEKKSRFIGTVVPVTCVEEAVEALRAIKDSYKDASHTCYAYSVGLATKSTKQSDDGEPSGTAGKPILDVIVHNDLRNVLLAVTRYFGGTLLGTGGLVHAYGKAANDVVTAAGLVTLKRNCCYEVEVDYHCYGKLQHEAAKMGFQIVDSLFTDTVTCQVHLEIELEKQFCTTVTDLTNAKGKLLKTNEVFLPAKV